MKSGPAGTDELAFLDDWASRSNRSIGQEKSREACLRLSGASRWRRTLNKPLPMNLTVLLGYILISLWLWKQIVPHMATHLLGGGLSDPGIFLWWLRWASYSILHGHNPFHTSYLNAPMGGSAMWNTSMLTVGALFLPITALLGAVVTFNLVCILGPALSAWTCSIWLRRHARLFPSVVGGLLFGFSPFVVQQGVGHLHLIWLCLVPIIAILLEDIIWRSSRPWWLCGPILGVVVAAQLLISSEVLLMTVIAMGLAMVVLAAMYRPLVRARLKPAALGLGSGVLVAGLLVGGPVLSQFSAANVIRGPVQSLDIYEGEPADLINPPSSVVLHTSHTAAIAARIVGFENGLYLGIPVIVVTVLACILVRRRRKLVCTCALVAGVFFIFSLGGIYRGPTGYGYHGPALPWGYIEHAVPLTQNILPVRFAIIIWLAVSLVIAIAFDEATDWLRRHGSSGIPVAVLAAICLAPLVPVPERLAAPVAPTPAFFTSSKVRQIPQGSVALVAPIPNPFDDLGMLWQVQSGMWFEQVGGYFLHPIGHNHDPSFFPGYPMLDDLLSVKLSGRSRVVFDGTVTAPMRIQALSELRQARAATIIVGTSEYYDQLVATVEQLLERSPDRLEGGVALWYVQMGSRSN